MTSGKQGREMSNIVREYLEYDQGTGKVLWRRSTKTRMPPDRIAGNKDKLGYIRIKLKGKIYLAHRVAWFLFSGSWPVKMLDHINGSTSDNRIENLREVTSRANQQNRKSHRDGRLPGVYFCKKNNNYISQAVNDYKVHYIGTFLNKEDGHRAYIKFLKEKGWELSRQNKGNANV